MDNQLSSTFGPVTVTANAGTTGNIIIETHGKAVVAVEMKNSGATALAVLSIKRRVASGGQWHTLQSSAASYNQVDPQVLGFAFDPSQTGYVDKDPTSLAPGEYVRIIIPTDGHAFVALTPLTGSGTTTVEGAYGLGD